MRRLLRIAMLLSLAAVVVAMAILILLPFVVERMKDDLVERVAGAIGEDVEIESLEMRSIAPWLRLNGLRVGSPALFRAGDASVRIDVGRSLAAGKLVGRAEISDIEIDLSRPSSSTRAQAEPSGGRGLPVPIDLAVEVRRGRLLLPEGRQVVVERLDGDVALQTLGGADLGATAEGVALQWRDRVTVVDTVRAAAHWNGELLSTEVLQASGPALTIQAATADSSPGAIDQGIAPTNIQLAGQLREVVEFAAASEVEVDGRASIDLRIEGPFGDPVVRATARVGEPSFRGVQLESLNAEIARRAGVWSADDIEAVWPAGRLVGALRLDESNLRLAGTVGWRDVKLDRLLNLQGEAAVASRESTGDADLTIDLDELDIRLEGRGRIDGIGVPSIPIEATVASDGKKISASAEVVVDADSRMTMRLVRDDTGALSGAATVRVAAIEDVLNALAYRRALPARGGFVADATLSGTEDAPSASLVVASDGLRLADGTPAELRVRGQVSTREATVESFSLRAGGGELSGGGKVAFSGAVTNQWTLRLAALPLQPILESLRRSVGWSIPDIAGDVGGDVSVNGRWSALEATARVGVDTARVEAVTLGKVDLAAEARAGAWRVDAQVSDETQLRAAATVAGRGTGVREVAVSIDDWPIEELVDGGDHQITGRLAGELRLVAAGRNADGTLRFAATDVRIGDEAFGDSEISGAGNAGEWRVEGTLLDGAMTLAADIQGRSGFPFEVRVGWEQEDMPAVAVAGEEIRVSSRGVLSMTGRLAALAEASAQIEVEGLKIASGDELLRSDRPVRARLDSGALLIDPAELRGGATTLTLNGGIGISRPATLVIGGVVDLEWAASLTPAVEEAKGALELEVDVKTAGALVGINGKAAIRAGGVEISGAPPATQIDASIRFSGSRAHIDALTGEIGGGRFSIGGEVGVDSGPDLRWSLADVGVEPIRDLEMILSGDGTLAGTWDAPPLLAGRIAIDNLLYDRNLEYQDLIPSFDRAMAPPQRIASDRPPLKLDLRVVARDGLYIENNIARLEARTDLRIRGTPRKPSPRGRIEVIDGSISLRGRQFDIENGVLTFRRDLPGEAQIDFTAESLIEADGIPYRVTVRVTGTTGDFRVHLGSEDGLSQTDIAALIAFGKTVAQVREGGQSDPAIDRLAGLAGGRVGGFLAGEAREVLPFDQIEIRPGYSPSTGQFEPQLRVGKSITPDLSAWLGQSFGVQPQTLVEASYALTHQVSTVLRWESQTHTQEGAFGGEVSQRFEFWGLPSWLTWCECRGSE